MQPSLFVVFCVKSRLCGAGRFLVSLGLALSSHLTKRNRQHSLYVLPVDPVS